MGLHPPGSGDFPTLTPAKAGTGFSDPNGCKAELTWMVVIFQDSLPEKYIRLSQKYPHSVMSGN